MLVRSLALFIATLATAGVFAQLSRATFDPTVLWIDLRSLAPPVRVLLLATLAVSLVAFALGAKARTLAIAPALFAIIAVANAVQFYALLIRGEIHTPLPVPFTLLTTAVCVTIVAGMFRLTPAPKQTHRVVRVASQTALCGVYAIVFALLQMYCFGKTDYVRSGDAIVVLGARAYADGRPSDALADRVRTAAMLYHQQRASTLIMSGGPGDGAIDEPTAMRDFAVSLGVPADAIVLDPTGTNTAATLNYLAAHHAHDRLIAVSHFYHLPRVKFAAEQRGLHLTTSPAREQYTLTQLPLNIAREVAAFWAYLARGA